MPLIASQVSGSAPDLALALLYMMLLLLRFQERSGGGDHDDRRISQAGKGADRKVYSNGFPEREQEWKVKSE